MTSSSWSNEKTVNFIDAVRSRPCLWNVTNLEYKNRNLKKDGWNAIGIEFGVPSDEAQKKFKNLRTYFKNEIKKVEKKQYSGSGASQWFAFKSMSFLVDLGEPDPGRDSELESEKNDESDDDMSRFSQPTLPPPPPPSARQKKKKNVSTVVEQYETACEVTEEVRKKRNKKTLAFGDHVNDKLLTYSKFVRNQVEYKIATVLYEADMGYYDRMSSHPGSSDSLLCQNTQLSTFVPSPLSSSHKME